MAHQKHPVFRVVFTVVSAISMLICLASLGLWVRSNWTRDLISLSSEHHCFGLASESCAVAAFWDTNYVGAKGFEYHTGRADPFPYSASRAGFGWNFIETPVNEVPPHGNAQLNTVWRVINVPHWFLAALFAILPTLWFIRHRRRRDTRGFPVLPKS